MAKRGGFPGGMGMPGNMNNMLKQAQRLQRQMEEQQKLMAETEYTGTAGGGAVSITLTGLKEMKKVSIDPEACDPEDVETLEELVMLAFNDAAAKIEQAAEGQNGKLGGFGF
ncbi:MAG: YbaB/EbfC family nucleoid-associated protein [Lachnospiraceae bacterium]|nr:YbaB/EbfC family nucleoid-associated protein [Lachnospiraceae bacterium]